MTAFYDFFLFCVEALKHPNGKVNLVDGIENQYLSEFGMLFQFLFVRIQFLFELLG